VDLLVKDIYANTKSTNMPLESDVIASSFGKIHHYIQTNQKDKIRKEDIAKSLLVMICYHIVQLAVLAAQPHDINK
jgi:pantothenate kinase